MFLRTRVFGSPGGGTVGVLKPVGTDSARRNDVFLIGSLERPDRRTEKAVEGLDVIPADTAGAIQIAFAAERCDIPDFLAVEKGPWSVCCRQKTHFGVQDDKSVVFGSVHGKSCPELFQVVETGDRVGALTCLVQGREQHRRQNGDDRYHDQEFDKSK